MPRLNRNLLRRLWIKKEAQILSALDLHLTKRASGAILYTTPVWTHLPFSGNWYILPGVRRMTTAKGGDAPEVQHRFVQGSTLVVISISKQEELK